MTKFVNLQEVIERQTPTIDGWICPDCKFWGTGLNCEKDIFISVVGANMRGCWGYIEKLIKTKERTEWRQNIKDSKT